MNVLKKIASAVAAVAVLAGISVPVGAADSTLKLLTEEVDSEFGSLPVDGLLCVTMPGMNRRLLSFIPGISAMKKA